MTKTLEISDKAHSLLNKLIMPLSPESFVAELIEQAYLAQEASQAKTVADYGTGLEAKLLWFAYEARGLDASVQAEYASEFQQNEQATIRLIRQNPLTDWSNVLAMLTERQQVLATHVKPVLANFAVWQHIKSNYMFDYIQVPNGLLAHMVSAKQLHNKLAELCIRSSKGYCDSLAIVALEASFNSQFQDNSELMLELYHEYA